jgi:hypothetical protein
VTVLLLVLRALCVLSLFAIVALILVWAYSE